MKTKIYFRWMLTGLLILSLCSIKAQQYQLKGKVVDKTTKESIPFANIVVLKNDKQIGGATTDFDGNFFINSLLPGNYNLHVSYVGYKMAKINNILLPDSIGKNKKIVVEMEIGSVTLDVTEIVTYAVPLIQSDQTSSGATLTSTDIVKMPGRDASSNAIMTGGVFSQGNNMGSVIGERENANNYPNQRNNLNFNTEDYDLIVENDFKKTKNDPLSTFSIDVDAASYSNCRRMIINGNLPPADAVRIEEFINYFDYDYPQPDGKHPFSVFTEYTECPWNKAHKLVHIGIKAKDIAKENLPPNNLTFLIDVSGSMRDYNKLPLVKKSLRLLINEMRSEDKIAIVVYAGASGLVLPATSGKNKTEILEVIEMLESGGSTAGSEGIILAYKVAKEMFDKNANNRVILATDGDFNVGVSSDGALERLIEEKRNDGIFLSVLGFGYGNYKDSKMEKLADKGNGNYAYIDNLMEAKKVLINQMGATLLTVAKDVKIQIEFNPAKVKAYRLVGYENRLLNKEDFNDDTKDAGELGAGGTVTALYEIMEHNGKPDDLPKVDSLKYQKTIQTSNSKLDEVLTLKIRYKEPQEKESKLMQMVIAGEATALEKASINAKFSSAAASFGMLLRESKFNKDLTYKNVIDLANSAIGSDNFGYRKEFINIVALAEKIK